MLVAPKLYVDSLVKYKDMKDKDIVKIAKSGDSLALDYLINKYENFVVLKTKPFFLAGGDRDDIFQEGMIGLFQAIRDYDETRLTSFIGFVDICIKRQIITAVKTYNRNKHIPLNSYISLNKIVYIDDSDRTLLETIEGNQVLDPMEIYINEEDFASNKRKMDTMLSKLELRVLKSYLQGMSYEKIALEINKDEKCIDNALQRIKMKFNNSSKK